MLIEPRRGDILVKGNHKSTTQKFYRILSHAHTLASSEWEDPAVSIPASIPSVSYYADESQQLPSEIIQPRMGDIYIEKKSY